MRTRSSFTEEQQQFDLILKLRQTFFPQYDISLGLPQTNWHVAYDAVRQASLAGKTDYLKDGFVSKSIEQDIPGPNYEVWITKSCVDVSQQVVSVIKSESDPLKRADKVRDVRQGPEVSH